MMEPTKQEIFDKLILDLTQGNEMERRYAAEDLEYGQFREAIPYLVEGLKDESRAVAESCSNSLIRMGGPEVAKALVANLASEDVRLRNLSNEVLSQLGQDAIDVLVIKLSDPDRDVRKFAIDAILEVKSAACLSALIQACEDPDVNIGATALDGIGLLGDEGHLDFVAGYLSHPDSWMQAAAIRAISQIGGAKARELLLQAVGSEDIVVRISAIQGLGKLADFTCIAPLLDAVRGPTLGLFGGEVVQALTKMHQANPKADYSTLASKDRLASLVELAANKSIEHRKAVLDLLEHMGEPALRPMISLIRQVTGALRDHLAEGILRLQPTEMGPLIEILTDSKATMGERSTALQIIARCNNVESESLVMGFLLDENIEIVMAALGAAVFYPSPEIGHQIRRLLLSQHQELRLHAARAMGLIGQAEFIQSLVAQMKQETDEEVRDAIDNALERIGTKTDNEVIARFLANFAPDERLRAMAFLGFQDPNQNMYSFKGGLKDSNPEIRMLSLKALCNLRQLSLEEIQAGIEDSVDYVRVEGVRSLRSLGNPHKIMSVARELLSKDLGQRQRVKVELIQILGQLEHPEATELILPLLQDPSTWVQVEAVEALRDLKDPRAIEPIRQLEQQTLHPELLAAVEQALQELE